MGAHFSVPAEGMNAIERAEFEKAEKQIQKIGNKAQNMTIYGMIMVGLFAYEVNKVPCSLYTKGSCPIVLMGALMMVLINYEAFCRMKMIGKEMAAKNNEGSFWDYILKEFVMLVLLSVIGLMFFTLCFWSIYTVGGCAMSPLPPI